MSTTHFLAGVILVGTITALTIPEPSISGPARIIDGDTIQIADKRIRLWGIDAPERHTKYGPFATLYLQKITSNATITCNPRDRDRYGRVVAQCFTMGRDLGAVMVANGWAIDWWRYSGGYYRDHESAAREQRVGIHQDQQTH